MPNANTYLPPILKVVQQLGYRLFTRNYELNIIGVRANPIINNKFDDTINVCFINANGLWEEYQFNATTDPSTYFLLHPIHKDGTAVLVKGQYINAYAIGLHKKQYTALVQSKPVKVYRNKKTSDINTSNAIATGMFGINLHHASGNGTSEDINRWSAGCQVIANINDFKKLMGFAQKHKQLYGNNFTYTLLDNTEYTVKKALPSSLPNINEQDNTTLFETLSQPQLMPIVLLSATALIGIGTTIYFLTSINKPS